MHFSTRPVLEQHSVFRSHDAEETRAFLSGKGFNLDIAGGRSGRLDVHMNGVYLPGSSPGRDCTYIGYVQYGAAVAVAAGPERHDYWVQFPIRGSLEMTLGRHTTAHDSTCACVVSPTRRTLMRSDEGSARLHVSLKRAVLTRQLAAFIDEPPRGFSCARLRTARDASGRQHPTGI